MPGALTILPGLEFQADGHEIGNVLSNTIFQVGLGDLTRYSVTLVMVS